MIKHIFRALFDSGPPVVTKLGPLLQIPLCDFEMRALSGLSIEERQRLGVFSPAFIAAMTKALEGSIETIEPINVIDTPKVFFKEWEPKTFAEYGGQQHITRYLKACIDGLEPAEPRVIANQCFAGVAGGGKTLLAKVTANELGADFIEVFTSDIPTVSALDELMHRVEAHPQCVVFIDELHTIQGKEHWTKFLEVLENKRYKFAEEDYPTLLPPFTILSATTDYGTLDEPWRRRFEERRFIPATYEQLLGYVKNRNVRPITDEAATAIVDRTHWGGAPWEPLWAYMMAVVFAKARKSPIIEPVDVETVWSVNNVDEYGLRPVDRDVLKAIFGQPRNRRDRLTGEQEFVCYAASEDNVVQMARVDRAEYRDYIRPKLMNRKLLEIRISYGQALTPMAVERYGYLND